MARRARRRCAGPPRIRGGLFYEATRDVEAAGYLVYVSALTIGSDYLIGPFEQAVVAQRKAS